MILVLLDAFLDRAELRRLLLDVPHGGVVDVAVDVRRRRVVVDVVSVGVVADVVVDVV